MSAPRSDNFKRIPIARILIGDRQRTFDPAWASAIAATLPDMGLKQPIEVSAEGDGFRLIAGFHRLQACTEAGWTEVPARIVTLDDANIDASAMLHEALENLMRNELRTLDRMAHLAAAKLAHDTLYPKASKRGPRTRADEDNSEIFSQFSFAQTISEKVEFTPRLVRMQLAAWAALSQKSRLRLRGTRFDDKQSELIALSKLEPSAQDRVLDHLLASPPAAATVEEAWAKVLDKELPDADARRVQRYAETIAGMPVEQRDRIFEANEEAVRDFARRRGWLA